MKVEIYSRKAIEKLKTYLEIDNFEAELVLIDPKEKQIAENINKIEEFCKKI